MPTTAQHPSLLPAVFGDRREFSGRAGRLSYYVDDSVTPDADPLVRSLLLIHSINAAGSAYEMKPIFERYRRSRPLYALELPGFGFSDRSERPYTVRLMTDAIHDMVAEIGRIHGVAPIDALALSLSCEFLARAAVEQPEAFRSLAFVSPTGFDRRAPYVDAPGSTRAMPWLYRALTTGGDVVFRLLTSRRSIRYFLKKTWGSDAIDRGLWDYDYLTTHQPGARYAPYAFVSGFLFSKDITRIYEQLLLPVWMAHGVRGDFTDYSYETAFNARLNWTIDVYQTGALPHFEVPAAFTSAYDAFLARVGAGDKSMPLREARGAPKTDSLSDS